jgi:hypothetical protein
MQKAKSTSAQRARFAKSAMQKKHLALARRGSAAIARNLEWLSAKC